jgi:hypothetical protein
MHTLVFARPRLYEIMLKRVPAYKISHNKRVLQTKEENGRVHIFCSDNTSYGADILVGADGAYSGVRQNLYRRLDAQGKLVKSDLENFEIGSVNMVAVAEPQDLSKYPQLKDDFCHFSVSIGDNGARTVSERGRDSSDIPFLQRVDAFPLSTHASFICGGCSFLVGCCQCSRQSNLLVCDQPTDRVGRQIYAVP